MKARGWLAIGATMLAVACGQGAPDSVRATEGSPSGNTLALALEGAGTGTACTDASQCADDTNTCTQAPICHQGQCYALPVPAGTACDDGNACTTDDACQFGVCWYAAVLDCDDGDPATLDGCDPHRGCRHAPTGCAADADCDDDDPATVGRCVADGCVYEPVDCDDLDGCTNDVLHPDGTCSHEACDDGNPCTTMVCLGAGPEARCAFKPVSCDDADPCTVDHCDPTLGACVHAAAPDGATCTDGDACTDGDLCQAGACTGTPRACDDGSACTVDICDAATGSCRFTKVPCPADLDGDGSPNPLDCDPSDAGVFPGAHETCNGLDDDCDGVVDDGVKCCAADAECDDKSPCTLDACVAGTCRWQNVADDTPCSDDNACTLDDACVYGVCWPAAHLPCDDGDACTVDACDAAKGCVHAPSCCQSDADCADGDPTTVDACVAAVCTHQKVTCDDGNGCTTDSLLPDGTCQHRACTDGNPCTDDVCAPVGTGVCWFPARSCDDRNACTVDACDPATGACVQVALNDGARCDDQSACTLDDACRAGVCSGLARACDDGDPCTSDHCAASTGTCVHGTAACTGDGDGDGVPDDLDGAPVDGASHLGANEICDDRDNDCDGAVDEGLSCCASDADCAGLPCKVGACIASTCVYTRKPNGTACEDGNRCTTSETCSWGLCLGGQPAACADDGDECTREWCEPSVGCRSEFVCCLDARNCDDADPRTIDTCDAGTCRHQPKSCDDGNGCTTDLLNADGSCRHLPCDDGDPCTVDKCNPFVRGTGMCYSLAVACDDHDPCNGLETCDRALGGCVAGAPVQCPAGMSCEAGLCMPGACNFDGRCDPWEDPAACPDCGTAPDYCNGVDDDGDGQIDENGCTDGAPCVAGVCLAQPGCTTDADCPMSGDACTLSRCMGGSCVHAPASCSDLDPCTMDTCLPDVGCRFERMAGCGECVDASDCPGVGACALADCVAGLCAYAAHPDGTECDDGSACSTGDTCQAGVCQGLQASCSDGDACTTDQCDPASGTCVFQDIPGCGPCAVAAECDDGNPCSLDVCATDGLCRHEPLDVDAAGMPVPCDDGDVCTANDRCLAGACMGMEPERCDDLNPCTTDVCDPAVGCRHDGQCPCLAASDCPATGACVTVTCQQGACSYEALVDGTTCDDGSACTVGEACTAGQCQGAWACDDGNACTSDKCGPMPEGGDGCVHQAVACDDWNLCTNDACDPSATDATSPCVFEPIPDCVCEPECATPDGAIKSCGPDHCGGTCGECAADQWCTAEGTCQVLCNCPAGWTCDATGACLPADCNFNASCEPWENPAVCPDCGTAADYCNGLDDDGDGLIDENGCTNGGQCVAGVCTSPALDCEGLVLCLNPCGDDQGCVDQCAANASTAAIARYNAVVECLLAVCPEPTAACQQVAFAGPCASQYDACFGGGGAACTSDAECPAGTRCDAATGQCVTTGCATDADCSTGSACEIGHCAGGTCQIEPVACQDVDPCTMEYCSPTVGCQRDRMPGCGECLDATDCAATDPCVATDCVAGLCTYQALANGQDCDDLSACTTNDACQGGGCFGAGKDCSDGDACTVDACDGETGECQYLPIVGCGPCTADVDCDDDDPCLADLCGADGLCRHEPADYGADGLPVPCDDGNACTASDWCKAGQCMAGPPASCDDLNPCTMDSCDPSLGCLSEGQCTCLMASECPAAGACVVVTCGQGVCVYAALPDDAPCDDGNGCTTGETCIAGQCQGSMACDDGDLCTRDLCQPVPEGGTACVSQALVCDDQNLCTADSCDPEGDPTLGEGGCTFEPIPGCVCEPQCATLEGLPKSCGPDQCGGACGTCDGWQACSADGQCQTPCTCPPGWTCTATGGCLPADCDYDATCAPWENAAVCPDCSTASDYCNGLDDDGDGPIDEDGCADGSTCTAGVCVAGCFDECPAGMRRCVGPGLQTCDDIDDDGCVEWSAYVFCDAGQACLDGICRPADTDADGLPDLVDNCPNVANPDQADSDADGLGDACDAPTNELCNGLDDDGDGLVDEDLAPTPVACGIGTCTAWAPAQCVDGTWMHSCLPGAPTPETCNRLDDDCDGQVDEGGLCAAGESCAYGQCSPDVDGDGVIDEEDNCGEAANPAQLDTDLDGLGDACDDDDDDDGVADAVDNCPGTGNLDQVDTDGDGVGDACQAPAVETCNGRDDDGDGQVDEGSLCAAGQSCQAGVCTISCADLCTPGVGLCQGTSFYVSCTDTNGDGCFEPTPPVPCPVGFQCTGPGQCVPLP